MRFSPDVSISLSAAASGSTTPAWAASTGESGEVDGAPPINDGVLYVVDAGDDLRAFDATGTKNCAGTPKTCTPLWTGAAGGAVLSPPVVVNGVVYAGSDDHKV